MAVPTTRKLFKDYCLRRLGYPVIDINVDDGQVDDRIDDALAYYRDFHFDGTEHIYLSYKITQTDVDNKFITLPDNINYVIRIFDIGRASSVSNLFNVRYQIHLNDLFDFTSTTYVPYVMGMRHIEELEQIFVGSKPIRFNRHNNRLYVADQSNSNMNSYTNFGNTYALDNLTLFNSWKFMTVFIGYYTIDSMNEIELLKKIPKEHYTFYNGKVVKVEDLLKKLYEKNISNGPARRRKNNTIT